MAFESLAIQPHLFRAALYEYLLGAPEDRVSLSTYGNQLPGVFGRYERIGASPALFDVVMMHPESPSDFGDHQGRVVLSNVLSGVEPGFGPHGEYRMRAAAYSAQDADTSALLAHVAKLLRQGTSKALPMPGQCFSGFIEINRSGPTYQSGSGLWSGSVDFKVRLIKSRSA